jgi:5'-3' exonuclease
MNSPLGMQAIAEEIRNSVEAAPDGLEGGGSAEELEDATVGAPVDTDNAETSGEQGAIQPDAKPESTRKIGADAALKILEEHGGPEAAEVLREFQRGYTRLSQERAEMDKGRLENRERAEVLNRVETKQTPEAAEEEDDGLGKIPPEQQALLQKWLQANNYVSQSELSAQESRRVLQELVKTTNERGVGAWGEDFGHFGAGGKFLINPGTRDEMAPVFDRMVNKNGLTFEDMYIVLHHNRLIDEAKDVGRREARNEENTRDAETSARLTGAAVAGRSATGARDPVVYDPEKELGDIGSVFRKIQASFAASQ